MRSEVESAAGKPSFAFLRWSYSIYLVFSKNLPPRPLHLPRSTKSVFIQGPQSQNPSLNSQLKSGERGLTWILTFQRKVGNFLLGKQTQARACCCDPESRVEHVSSKIVKVCTQFHVCHTVYSGSVVRLIMQTLTGPTLCWVCLFTTSL